MATRQSKSSSRDKILDLALHLMMRFGYNGFSYADISKQLHVKNAAIHYHFPVKADLVKAVVQRYTEHFRSHLLDIDNNPVMTASEKFDAYVAPFVQVADTGIKICLCGALAGEALSLPKKVCQETQIFFSLHEAWLTHFLDGGRKGKVLRFDGPPSASAKLVFSALQGALLAARVQQDVIYYHDIVKVLKRNFSMGKGSK